MKNIKIDKKVTFILFAFCLILSFLMCFSPLAQGNGHGFDSAIYAAIGNALNKGRVLYTEIIDNKGPLLYFIDAIGLAINYKFGIFFIEFVFLFIGSIFGYKTGMIITKNNKCLSIFSVIFSLLMLLYTLDGGNYTEEYAILFINIATYFVVKFISNNYKLKNYELIIIGICFAATFLIRANLCAFYVSQVLVILICLIKEQKFKILLNAIIYIVIGVIVTLIPFLIYLILNGALLDCINIVYLGVINSFETVSLSERFTKLIGLIEIANKANVFSIIALALVLFFSKLKIEKQTKIILIISFIGVIINLYVNSLTGGQAWAYTHYFISFVPLVIVISTWTFNVIYNLIKNTTLTNENKKILLIILLFLLVGRPSYELLITSVQRFDYKEPEKTSIEKYIENNSDSSDTIQMIGLNETVYYPTNRISTSKHLYFVPGFSEDRRKKDANELANDLYNAKEKSKIIMLTQGTINENEFIKSLNDKNKFIEFLNKYYIYDEKASKEFNCNTYLLKK